MQIRERSRKARRTGSDGEDSCDHVQNTARGVVSSAPSRRTSKRSSVGKVLVCKNGEQREILKNTQVEDAGGERSRGHQGRKNLVQTLLLSLDRAHNQTRI